MYRQTLESLTALDAKGPAQADGQGRQGKPEITKYQFSGDNNPPFRNSVLPDSLNHGRTAEQECKEGPAAEDQCPFAEGLTFGRSGWHTSSDHQRV
jgi:hypothetical protein